LRVKRQTTDRAAALRIPNVAVPDALAWAACAIVVLLPVMQPRYVDVPALLPYPGIVAQLRQRGLLPRINNRSESLSWTAVVAAVTYMCQRPGMGECWNRRAWWLLQIPCSRV
jgi:hypothetical protein